MPITIVDNKGRETKISIMDAMFGSGRTIRKKTRVCTLAPKFFQPKPYAGNDGEIARRRATRFSGSPSLTSLYLSKNLSIHHSPSYL